MVLSLSVSLLTWRAGLALRRARLGPGKRTKEMRERHLRIAKRAVAMDFAGFFLGVGSAWFLRNWIPFQTAHAWIGLAATSLFVSSAVVGRRIELGQSRAIELHARLTLAAMLAAGLAAFTGFVLLP